MDAVMPHPPQLAPGESYHIFCSYSSTDYQWTQSLIQQLKARGLKVCDQERDLIPGRPVLQNLFERVEESQKLMLILSAEFVRSRWCLLEANMSLFRDCLQRKPIVPVLLQRDVSFPLQLSHLTYLDVQNHDFLQQLIRVMCTPNQDLQSSTVVSNQTPSLYHGKSLEPVPAVNEKKLNKFDCGVWSDVVPDQLTLIIQQPETYREAINIINTVSQTKTRFRPLWAQALAILLGVIFIFFYSLGIALFLRMPFWNMPPEWLQTVSTIVLYLMIIPILYKMNALRMSEIQRIVRKLQNALGQANALLLKEKILMGSESNSKLFPVYVCLDSCREELSAQDPELFHKSVLEHSSAYACSLAKGILPAHSSSDGGHLVGGICFCQFVTNLLHFQQRRVLCCTVQQYVP